MMIKSWAKIEKHGYVLFFILAVGFVLRALGVEFGKPFRYHPDELKMIYQAGNLLKFQEWSRETVFLIGVYPPLFTYVLAFASGVYSAMLLVLGVLPSVDAITEFYYQQPFVYHLIARWISVISGTLSLWLVYKIGEKLYSRFIGLLAAAFLSASFLHVRNSHFGVVDIFVSMLVLFSFYFSVQIFRDGRTRYYILAAIFAAFSIAGKWNTGLILMPILLSHFLREKSRPHVSFFKIFFHRNLMVALIALSVTFLLACPMPLVDFKEFFGGIIGTAKFQQSGVKKLGAGGDFWSYFTGDHSPGYGFFYDNSFPASMGWFPTIFFSLAILYLLWRRKPQDLLLLIFPVIMYLIIGPMQYKAMRHLLPLVPFLLLSCAVLIDELKTIIPNLRLYKMLLALFCVLMIVPTGVKALRYDLALRQVDTRTIMKDWIEIHIPNHAKIGIDEFGPALLSIHDLNYQLIAKSADYKRSYDVHGLVPGMFVHGQKRTSAYDPSRYIWDNHIDHVIISSFTQERLTWEQTQRKHPLITQQRQDFMVWLEKNAVPLFSAAPQNDFHISPRLVFYRIKSDAAPPDDKPCTNLETTRTLK